MSLFGPIRHQAGSGHLIEFRAGKLSLNAQTKMCTPDKRKGLVYIHQSDDTLMHLCWKDRTTGTVEDDLIIFPDDAEFMKVKSCKSGRTFVLKMKGTGRKYFFWLQEPKTDKDTEYFTKMNDLLSKGPSAVSSTAGGRGSSSAIRSSGGGASGLPAGLAESMTPEQLAMMQQLFGGAGGGGSADSDNPEDALSGLDQQQFLQLWNLMGGGALGGGGSGSRGAASRLLGGPGFADALGGTGIGDTPHGGELGADGGSDGATDTPPPSAGAAGETETQRRRVQLSDLQSVLASMNIPGQAGGGAAPSSTAPAPPTTAGTAEVDVQSVAEMIGGAGETGASSKDSSAKKGKDKSPDGSGTSSGASAPKDDKKKGDGEKKSPGKDGEEEMELD